ncbi:MAG: toll/interleukin-1 receptor domain-containing protein [Thermodesulfobacteriota bacterium]
MKVFVCHSSKDAGELSKIKSCLQKYGFDLFLAHKDIPTTEKDFVDKIKGEINICDVFLLIANCRSKTSSCCNQEIGFALAEETIKGKKILVFFEGKDYAPQKWDLLGFRQGVPYKNWDELCKKLLAELNKLKDDDTHSTSSEINTVNNLHSDLRIMNLLGSWNSSFQQDKAVVESLLDGDFETWIEKMRELVNKPQSPITLKNGIAWQIKKNLRLTAWEAVGESIFDDNLNRLRECAISILSEHDPKFDLNPEKRFMAEFYKKIPNHSQELKKGIAETLALLANKPDALKYCPRNKAKDLPISVIREVFQNEDWTLWASLKDVLPLLAEASPEMFISIVERLLHKNPCPLDNLFPQTNDTSIFVDNNLVYLLFALETIAWEERHLARVTTILGELASRDKGLGNWGNRPINSLSTIFLPWLPQTMASWEKQRVAMDTLRKNNPDIAWKVLLSLLPGVTTSSSGCQKPWSYSVRKPEVSGKDYEKQIASYRKTITDMAMADNDKLIELVESLYRLDSGNREKLTKHIESHDIPKEKRFDLWQKLIDFTSTHKKFADADWTLKREEIEQIDKTIEKIAPEDLQGHHSYLFDRENYELYDEQGSYEDQEKKIENRRQKAIKEILEEGGVNSVIEFAQKVKFPLDVGLSFGSFVENEVDSEIFEKYLEYEQGNIADFVTGFIRAKHRIGGWNWVDKLNTDKWTETQKCHLLLSLPARHETWKRVETLLTNTRDYWAKAFVHAPHFTEEEFQMSVDNLLKVQRPISALNCFFWMDYNKLGLPPEKTIKALTESLSTKERNAGHCDSRNIAKIIKNLQNNPKVNPDELIRIEVAYFKALEYESDYSPKTLEYEIASEPEFFHKILSRAYRSESEETKQLSEEEEESIAGNSFAILKSWKTVPGTQPDETFSEDKFKLWIEKSLELCEKSGRLKIGQQCIGEVLIHSPEDPNGLWIHSAVAEILDGSNMNNMRTGFSVGIHNSRGASWVDPEGKPERELAKKYREKADKVEDRGYHRLASTLRDLANSYERMAQQNIDMAKDREES